MTKRIAGVDQKLTKLQEQVNALNEKLAWTENELALAEKRCNEHFMNARRWKEALDNSEKARNDAIANQHAHIESRIMAEKHLSYAEGFIAALKGEPYQNSTTISVDGSDPLDFEQSPRRAR